MLISVLVCLASFVAVVAFLRRKRISLGLPIAYFGSLLLIHVPGAVAHIMDVNGLLTENVFTEAGIALTAIGSVCFLVGVMLGHVGREIPVAVPAPRAQFWNFCLLGGTLVTTISYLVAIPSIGAVLQKGGPIWMFGVLLGLRSALRRSDLVAAWRWLSTLALYPVLMLLLGGFLSYGSVAATIVLSAIAVTARKASRVYITTALLVFVGISIFLGYFQNRTQIRSAVWGGADTDARIEASTNAFKDVAWFDPTNVRHLAALDARLNQNYFVGLAAARINRGVVDYLYGRSILEGFEALVPRALWPEKPVAAGSPKVVAEMTGLMLSTSTSFGVGNVMEFDINFGVPGVIVGFMLLGFAISRLDRLAAEAEMKGDLGRAAIMFLTCVAIIQPNGSLVEIMGGGASALAAGYGWRWAWSRWPKPRARKIPMQNQLVRQAS